MSYSPKFRRRPALLESLEPRTLLSAVVSAKGTLVATGTSGNDTIVVSRDRRRPGKILVSINGTGVKFVGDGVKRIEMYGQGGTDALTLDDSLGIISNRGASLYGGDGNDTLAGGLAAATFDGGNGDDVIRGSSKPDAISAGAGNDTVYGGKGDDQIDGDGGSDALFGSAGNDRVYGDAGDDTLMGEAGNDTLGGDGEDRLWFKTESDPAALTGNDSLDGGDGDDWLTGGDESTTLHDQNNGLDTLTGGPGNDVLDARGGGANPDDLITDRAAGDVVPVEDHTRAATSAELALGEAAYAVHVHATLIIQINVGGVLKQVQIPSGEGDFVDPNVANTGPALHVHSGAGEDDILHMHDLDPHVFTLGEFFRGWGVTLDATHIGRYAATNGHTLTMTVKHGGVNGGQQPVANTQFGDYVIQGAEFPEDGDIITITYT
jgi:Ca2+-binding RTX toxin-like protein